MGSTIGPSAAARRRSPVPACGPPCRPRGRAAPRRAAAVSDAATEGVEVQEADCAAPAARGGVPKPAGGPSEMGGGGVDRADAVQAPARWRPQPGERSCTERPQPSETSLEVNVLRCLASCPEGGGGPAEGGIAMASPAQNAEARMGCDSQVGLLDGRYVPLQFKRPLPGRPSSFGAPSGQAPLLLGPEAASSFLSCPRSGQAARREAPRPACSGAPS